MVKRQSEDAAISPVDRNRWGWVLLFGSSATLVCCALPIALVSLGLGSVSAALFANLPFLGDIATHKGWWFAGSFAALTAAGWALFRPGRACPADPELARLCAGAHRFNTQLWWVSIAIWSVGLFSAYALLPLWVWLAE